MSRPDQNPNSDSPAAQLAALGPKPFVFHPSTDTIEGPAFSRAFQAITWATLLGSGYWLLSLWQQGKFGNDTGLEGLRAAGESVFGFWLGVDMMGFLFWQEKAPLGCAGGACRWG